MIFNKLQWTTVIGTIDLLSSVKHTHTDNTVNVEIFAQYIFSRISRRAIDARKFDVSENYNHNRTNRIKWYVREN